MKKVKLHMSTYSALLASIDIVKNEQVVKAMNDSEKRRYASDLMIIIEKQMELLDNE